MLSSYHISSNPQHDLIKAGTFTCCTLINRKYRLPIPLVAVVKTFFRYQGNRKSSDVNAEPALMPVYLHYTYLNWFSGSDPPFPLPCLDQNRRVISGSGLHLHYTVTRRFCITKHLNIQHTAFTNWTYNKNKPNRKKEKKKVSYGCSLMKSQGYFK